MSGLDLVTFTDPLADIDRTDKGLVVFDDDGVVIYDGAVDGEPEADDE